MIKNKSASKILLSNRDHKILRFLWKFKVATTAALAKRYFPELKVSTAYRRLWLLKNKGYIQFVCDWRGQNYAWALDKNGFRALRDLWSKLRQIGYASENVGHDIIVTAAHLGEYLCEIPKNIVIFTEQELRRYDPEFYPKWVPRSNLHRPDGYWYIQQGLKDFTAALEVEVSFKVKSCYTAIADFYKDFPQITNVIWITSTIALANWITQAIQESIGNSPFIHDFVLLDQFTLYGWHAKIASGPNAGKPMGTILNFENKNGHQTFDVHFLLDTRKAPIKTLSSKIKRNSSFTY